MNGFYKIFFLIISTTSYLFCQDPIISVWYIGTRVSGGGPYNHYMELYNPTEEPIDLSQYALIKGHGQSNNVEQQAGWGNTLANSGVSFNRLPGFILFPGQSYGISRDVSHESLQNHADLILEDEGVLSVSGDDAVGLFKGSGDLDEVLAATDSIPIDCIGSPYEDPGQGWQVSGEVGPSNSTATTGYGVTRFAILTRKQDVCYGNAGNWNDSRGCVTDSCTNWLTETPQTTYENSQWDVYACYYPDAEGNSGPGYEPDTNPNCDEDILIMEGFANTCDLSENQAPVSEAGLDQTTSYNQVVTLDGSGSSDPDGTIESYEWSQISGANVILSSNDQLTTTFTSPNEEGELVFKLTVFDNDFSSDVDTVVITIINTNVIPIANAGVDQLVNNNELVTLDGSGSSDPDGTIEFYEWSQLSGTGVVLSSADQPTTTFTSPSENDILVFILSIEDELGGVDSDTISIVVQGVTTSVDEKTIPEKIKLLGNYPNPFNPKTDIVFQVLKETNVVVSIYNVYGQRVWIKNLGLKERGACRVSWFGKNTKGEPVVSGVYFYHIIAGGKQLINKMSLLK
tara:strand:+ start:1970 stop:3679 length:1710 start_codon:yes stop_codon:yes gene_type:complete